MSRPLDVSLPDPLSQGLSRLESHLRSLLVVRGVGVLFVVIALSLGAGLLIDLAFNLGPRARLALLATHGLVAGAAAVWLVLRPLLRRMPSDELAAVVETAYPQLGERLISTIELNDPTVPDSQKGSALMREELLRQTVESSQTLDFTSSVPPVRSLRLFMCGAIGVLLLILPYLFSPGVYGLLWSRLLSPWGNFDSAGSLMFVVPNGDRVVARGDDVTILAKPRWRHAAGEITEPVWLVRSGAGAGAEQDTRRMEWDEASGSFTTTIAGVLNEFEFNVSSGNTRSRAYRVDVLDPPEIAELTLDVDPPAYTGRVAERHDGALGDIAVFEHSKLIFHAGFNKPVGEARFEWLDNRGAAGEADNRPATPLAIAPDGLSATLEIEATRGGPFALHLTDEHGLRDRQHPPRAIRLVRDEPPSLRLGGSDEPAQARPGEKVRVEVEAFDDIAVEAVELHAQTPAGDTTILKVDAAKLGASRVQHDFVLDLDALKMTQGSVLTYRVRAADGRPTPGPQEVWSNRRVLTIDSAAAEQGAQELAKRQEDLKKKLEEARAQLVENRKQTAQLQRSAAKAAEQKTEFAENDQLPQLPVAQLDLAKKLEALANDFKAQPLYEKLADRTNDVAHNEVAESSANLTKAADGTLPEKNDALKDSVNKLIVADEKLTEIAKQFDQLAGIEHDLLELNKLAREAQKLADNAQDLQAHRQAAESDKPENQTAQQKQARDEELARNEEQLRKQQQQLDEQLKKMLDRQPELVNAARQQQLDRLAELSKQAADLAQPQEMLAQGLRDEPPKSDKETLDDENRKAAEEEKENAKDAATPPSPKSDSQNQSQQQPESKQQQQSQPESQPQHGSQQQPPSKTNEELQAVQQQAALSAAKLAMDAAQQTGASSKAAGKALEATRQASDAARSLLAGQLERAAESAQKAGESAGQAASEMSADSPAGTPNESLSQQAQQLAAQQAEIAKDLAGRAQSSSERTNARMAGERQLASETRLLTQQLDEIASRLSVEPLTMSESAKRADEASQATRRADQSMQKTGESMQKSDHTPAAESAQQAAADLRQAAERAAAGAPDNRQRGSPVPAEIAERVTDAARQLDQARQQLAAKAEQGAPENKTATGEKADPTQQGKQASQQAGSGSQQRQAKALADSAQSLKQAAEGLTQAAKRLEPGQQSKPDADQPSGNAERGDAGGGVRTGVDLGQLENNLQQKFSKREWGQLPGQLQTEILQSAGRTPNSNYARLIRLYFREIAENKSTDSKAASPNQGNRQGDSASSIGQK